MGVDRRGADRERHPLDGRRTDGAESGIEHLDGGGHDLGPDAVTQQHTQPEVVSHGEECESL